VIVSAGYIGLEMAEALTARGLAVTQVEMLPEVLPTVDPELGRLIHARLTDAAVDVATGTRVQSISDAPTAPGARLVVTGSGGLRQAADLVLVVRPDAAVARTAGVRLGPTSAVIVDQHMATGVPHVWAAGDCVTTRHRLLGDTYLPLGTTAHKQGRVAGENAAGGHRAYPGSLGTLVVKVFDLVIARTGLRDADAAAAGYKPKTTTAVATDRTGYYPGAHPLTIRVTGDQATGRLLGVQLAGHLSGEVAERIDAAAAAIHAGLTVDQVSDLDLSYTPPLGTAWDALQIAAQTWQQTTAGQRTPARQATAR
jgi:NADPH-dependent 2,4-dienoyl-CoA reductase/sulfur reductase-like enzyme